MASLSLTYSTQASATSYFTVTVDGGGEDKKPGDNSPHIPAAIARLMAEKYTEEGGSNQEHYGAGIDWFLNKVRQVGDGHVPWWCSGCGSGDHSPGMGGQNMTYECDASLRAPRPADCSQLDYSQLGAPSDLFAIDPATPKIISSSE